MPTPTAVITGASRGIGRAIAVRLAPTYRIVAVARSADALAELASEIAAAGGSCDARPADITDPAAVQRALSDVEADVLVSNAGVGTLKPFLELTRAEWRTMLDVNFGALYDVTRAVVPGMVSRGRGHVVLIGSISGRSAFVGGTGYAATKAALQSFAESLMLELRDDGIKVSLVAPGGVDTGFSGRTAAHAVGNASWKLPPDAVAEAVATVIDTPRDVLIHRIEVRTLTVPKGK